MILTLKEAAGFLRLSTSTVYRYVRKGLIPYIRKGRRILFIQKDLEVWIEKDRHLPDINLTKLLQIPIFEMEKGKANMPLKGKSKNRLNLGIGSVYKRKTKDGKQRFYLDYYVDKKKRKRELCRTATNWTEAVEALREKVLKLHARKYGIEQHVRKETTFKGFAEIYLRDYIKVNRRNYYSDECRLRELVKFFKDMELREITPMLIERFRASRLKKGNSKSTINQYLAVLKKMFNLAVGEGYCEENPVKKVKYYRQGNLKERVLTAQEERKLLEVSTDNLRAIITVALNTGMRRGEILNLKWTQVDFETKMIKVEKTKSDKVRYVPINTHLYHVMKQLRSENGRSPYVFVDPKTRKSLTSIRSLFQSARREAGIEDLRFHDFRHTFATRLIQAGVDIVTVQKLLGHSSVLMTERYTHTSDEQRRKAVEKLNLSHRRHMEKEESPVIPLFSVN